MTILQHWKMQHTRLLGDSQVEGQTQDRLSAASGWDWDALRFPISPLNTEPTHGTPCVLSSLEPVMTLRTVPARGKQLLWFAV